ncbi:hypothetical protein L2E82_08154 [Cichorium intybus]|uniref:Uncharacterized protein n=1 Tax=Cichorium intybus TaxID=13427 RepID=A0ACB9G5T8_CICIN|nr:hypothetical protein L2E82_08154 [Cichorium intybus]
MVKRRRRRGVGDVDDVGDGRETKVDRNKNKGGRRGKAESAIPRLLDTTFSTVSRISVQTARSLPHTLQKSIETKIKEEGEVSQDGETKLQNFYLFVLYTKLLHYTFICIYNIHVMVHDNKYTKKHSVYITFFLKCD